MSILYVIKPGDTLVNIVNRECPHVPWQDVAELNGITNPHLIYAGQVIELPIHVEGDVEVDDNNTITYTVKSGDTLSRICEQLCPGKSIFEVAADNNIENIDLIEVGQQIIINCIGGGVPIVSQQGGGKVETTEGAAWLPNVPFYSQNDSDSNKSGTDCGPAALRMIIGWDRIRSGKPDNRKAPTVNHVWDDVVEIRRTHFPNRPMLVPGQFTFLDELIETGRRKYQLNLWLNRQANLARIKQEIDAGRPVIALVCYGSLNNFKVTFRGGHFVPVVGYTPDHIIINDPIGWHGAENWDVPNDTFDQALRHAGTRCATPANPDYHAIFVQ